MGVPLALRRSPVLDHNRPATGEEHRMLSVGFYTGTLERDAGDMEQRRNWVEEDAVPCGFPKLSCEMVEILMLNYRDDSHW